MSYPKIDDDIYKEIENFEDYEYINCIAYEMAIRSQNFINDFDITNEDITNAINLKNIDISNADKNYLLDFIELSEVSRIFFNNNSNNLNFEDFLKTNKKIKSIIEDTLIFEDRLNKYGKLEYLKTLNKKSKKVIAYNLISPQKLNIKYSRPKIKIKELNLFSVDLNLNLPKDELIAYISKIKDDFDKDNSIIKTPLELLGEELEKANEIESKALPKGKKKRKKAMADAFYVYDMYKILENEYAQKTKELKIERDEKIKAIKEDKYNYDISQKKSMINDLREYYDDELRKCDKNSIKTEIQSQSNLSLDKIEKYKALMNKYIDELKYKELITGITN